jgi:transposase-like protein
MAVTVSRRYGRIDIRIRPGARCHLCDAPVSARDYGDTVTLDHVRPQAHGGRDEHVLPACQRCNSFRGAAPIEVARLLLREGRADVRRISAGTRARIVESYSDGSLPSLAAAHGITEHQAAEVVYLATQHDGWGEDRERAFAMLDAGARPRDLRAAFGRTDKAIYKLMRGYYSSHEVPEGGMATGPYTDAEKARALAMRTADPPATIREIARALGRSHKSVEKFFRRIRDHG